ncbi:hypothetical protein [Bacillus sp. MMSF_3328]|uniref:hypothetical protein n=1 Tax=Bacillus sp. MMSF_3328 TaxID=3047080 RepID=UPI00273EF0C9|nr:hypothetical protein [Bacillus sp. MMSF_3328]
MRYQLENQEGNKVKVTDTVTGATYYGSVENGYARANTSLAMQIISKALKQSK